MEYTNNNLPAQQLSVKRKNKKWRKAHLDWADSKTFFNYNPVRKSVIHKKINYDLVNGVLHMEDVELLLNPESIKDKFTPTKIQHYPIINTKLQLLVGEAENRIFEYKVVVTNPLSISEKEKEKKEQMAQQLQQLMFDTSADDQQFSQKMQELSDYFMYNWQDMREVRANELLKHYSMEQNFQQLFVDGYWHALISGEEIYQCDIRGGEPILEIVNPLKIRIFRSGFSNKIEDADVIIMEDYWSPSKIIDAYYDTLTKKDIDYIESAPSNIGNSGMNSLGQRDERYEFINHHMMNESLDGGDYFFFDPFNLTGGIDDSLLPFDTAGNVRILRMYWKSRRKIKKVKSYDQETGEPQYTFYDETYRINKDAGEEETIYYINEAWEGTKIGEEIYVNMRPRVVQYNRLSSPSRCHFGIVGSIYNINDNKPFSMVDMMKPYNYLYDVIHDRLNKAIARNWGKIMEMDLSKVPDDWSVDKWMYYARHNNLAVIDSMKEGKYGAAAGKLAGALNNNSRGVIDANMGDIIQQYINLLEFIRAELADVVGISKQREGQISNRETVGGVERATLQSSHITEWWFSKHDDVKRRALECFLETAKVALKGQNKKFQYILSDGSMHIMDIDGDEFADSDYGLIVDGSKLAQELNQKLDGLAQVALQNQAISFSSMMKLFSSASIAEKTLLIAKEEQATLQRQQEAQQQEMQMQQQKIQADAELQQQKMQQEDLLNQRDNETKILVAEINAQGRLESQLYFGAAGTDNAEEAALHSQEEKEQLAEKIRQFDEKISLEREKLKLNKDKVNKDYEIKKKQLSQKKTSNNK